MKDFEKLKKNKVAFGLLLVEERECFEKVGRDNCIMWVVGPSPAILQINTGQWRNRLRDIGRYVGSICRAI